MDEKKEYRSLLELTIDGRDFDNIYPLHKRPAPVILFGILANLNRRLQLLCLMHRRVIINELHYVPFNISDWTEQDRLEFIGTMTTIFDLEHQMDADMSNEFVQYILTNRRRS